MAVLRALAATALCLALAGSASAQPARAKARPAPRPADWTRTVTAGADGSYVIGNPRSPVLVTEYASYTCSHCAEASATVIPKLMAAVRAGQVRYELRHLVRDPFDLTAAIIARCGGPRRFLAVTERLFREQANWLGGIEAWRARSGAAVEAAPEAERPWLVGQGIGLVAIGTAGGLDPAAQKACLSDERSRLAPLAMTEEGRSRAIRATPAFLVNGELAAGVHDWPALEAKIKAAAGS
jgi:protein-disulfide isomerase